MVAVHDPKVVRDESCRRAECIDVLGDNNPALCYCGFQHTLVIDATKARPVRR